MPTYPAYACTISGDVYDSGTHLKRIKHISRRLDAPPPPALIATRITSSTLEARPNLSVHIQLFKVPNINPTIHVFCLFYIIFNV
jgi:hypothetical protein